MNEKDLVMVVSNYNRNVSSLAICDAIKEAGFKKVFLQWYNRPWAISQEAQLAYAKSIGLKAVYAHLSYDEVNNLWLPEGDYLVDYYKRDLKICKDNGMDLVMMHITGIDCPKYSKIGLERLKQIVAYAEELKIKIALENVEHPGYLEKVLKNITSPYLGICFDTGHFHCYFKDKFNFDFCKDRIFAVHLHDNKGDVDRHMIPFDGTIKWDYILKKLHECNYDGPIILECVYRGEYIQLPLEEFYKRCFKAGQKLQEMYQNIKQK